MKETVHFLHPSFLSCLLFLGLLLPDRVFGKCHAQNGADAHESPLQIADRVVKVSLLHHFTDGFDGFLGELAQESVGQSGSDVQVFVLRQKFQALSQ